MLGHNVKYNITARHLYVFIYAQSA